MSHLDGLIEELQHVLSEVEKDNLTTALSRLDQVLETFESSETFRVDLKARPDDTAPDNIIPLRKRPALRPRTVARRRASA